MAGLVGFSPRVMRVLHDRSLRSALANVREQSSLGADSTVESETRPCSWWKKEGEIRGNTRAFFFSSLVRVRRRTHALHRNCATLVLGDSRRMWYSRRYSTSFSRKKGKERTGRSVRSVLLDAFLYFLLGLFDLVPSIFFSKLPHP